MIIVFSCKFVERFGRRWKRSLSGWRVSVVPRGRGFDTSQNKRWLFTLESVNASVNTYTFQFSQLAFYHSPSKKALFFSDSKNLWRFSLLEIVGIERCLFFSWSSEQLIIAKWWVIYRVTMLRESFLWLWELGEFLRRFSSMFFPFFTLSSEF